MNAPTWTDRDMRGADLRRAVLTGADLRHADLTGFTSRVLRQEFPRLRSRLPTLWSRSYFAASVGNVSEATIARYIEEQKSR